MNPEMSAENFDLENLDSLIKSVGAEITPHVAQKDSKPRAAQIVPLFPGKEKFDAEKISTLSTKTTQIVRLAGNLMLAQKSKMRGKIEENLSGFLADFDKNLANHKSANQLKMSESGWKKELTRRLDAAEQKISRIDGEIARDLRVLIQKSRVEIEPMTETKSEKPSTRAEFSKSVFPEIETAKNNLETLIENPESFFKTISSSLDFVKITSGWMSGIRSLFEKNPDPMENPYESSSKLSQTESEVKKFITAIKKAVFETGQKIKLTPAVLSLISSEVKKLKQTLAGAEESLSRRVSRGAVNRGV